MQSANHWRREPDPGTLRTAMYRTLFFRANSLCVTEYAVLIRKISYRHIQDIKYGFHYLNILGCTSIQRSNES